MRSILAFAALLAATLSAAASGGLGCQAEDKSAEITIESGVTRGMGGPIFNFRGRLEILDKRVADDLRQVEFADAHVAQYWLDDKDLRLLLYRERPDDKPHGSVELEIRTQAIDEGSYAGSYSLGISDMTDEASGEAETVRLGGPITCFAE